mmetsp:Transcript_25494/g.55834  ORF Transcript_25494/g.55834 Transcript_25494/m.55834 type:complete len:303 (-) Transcript_25494:5-913(-)
MSVLGGGPEAGCIRVVVQRCTSARLLIDAEKDKWSEVGRGLVLYISFATGAAGAGDDGRLRAAVKSILTAPLSTSTAWSADHSDADSVIGLCKRGEAQALLVVPQASLVSKLESGERTIKYHRQCAREEAKTLYDSFVAELHRSSRQQLSKPSIGKQHDPAAWQELQAKRAAAAAIPPDSYFKVGEYEGKYSQYDERGVPTHSVDGEALAKSAIKKLEKLYTTQLKKFEKGPASRAEVAESAKPATAEAEGEDMPREIAPSEEPGTELLEGACLPTVVSGTFGGRQGFELVSSGPFTHQFSF